MSANKNEEARGEGDLPVLVREIGRRSHGSVHLAADITPYEGPDEDSFNAPQCFLDLLVLIPHPICGC
uniref:Uncharacterized protein n=1 Tax=Caenorhabditis tropicalis TaxID=1561998 RepID=A0A1I7U2Q5_9PELO